MQTEQTSNDEPGLVWPATKCIDAEVGKLLGQYLAQLRSGRVERALKTKFATHLRECAACSAGEHNWQSLTEFRGSRSSRKHDGG